MNERDKYLLIIITVMVIIILILLFFSKFGTIENKYLRPTGNIDVFNIDIDSSCGCDKNKECNNNKKNNNYNNNYYYKKKTNNNNEVNENNDKNNDKKTDTDSLPVWDEEEDKDVMNRVYVDDNNGDYIYQKNLRIFNNAFYEYTNKIAPGVSNSYYFVVHNSSDMNIRYYLEMYSDTKYDINLKYRLKRNGNYIIGSSNKWVTANELKTSFSNLNIKDSDKYQLDWKWIYESGNDEKDTYIGENMDSLYKLNVRFYFEQV